MGKGVLYGSTSVWQGLALWLGFIGLFYNPFLIFIALFVWIGVAAEAGSAQIKSTLSGTAVGRAMLTDFQTLSPNEPLNRVVKLTLVGSQKEFPVLVDGVMVGVLTQTDLLKGIQARGEQAQVGDWMQREVHASGNVIQWDRMSAGLHLNQADIMLITLLFHFGAVG